MKKISILLIVLLPFLGFSQFKTKFMEMEKDANPSFENYDKLVYEATTYIFSHPVNPKSEDFFYSVKIAKFWMNKDTGFGMPIFGTFYNKLPKEQNQQFFYTLAMMHYNLIQKMEKGRVIILNKVEGIKFSDLKEVKEVQYEGAKIFLNYVENPANNLPLNTAVREFIDSNKKGTLQEVMFN